MNVYYDLDELPEEPIEPIATMGNMDGVHRGHQVIISRLRQEAERRGEPTMAITFQPHTLQVIRPDLPFAPLMTLAEKLRRFEELGLDHVLVVPFDSGVAEMSAREFVEEILWEPMKVSAMYVGHDAAFGKDREGDLRYLQSEGRRLGFHVGAVEALWLNKRRVSSSWARKALASGNLDEVNRILGRDYVVSGQVLRGFKMGRELGYPTANIAHGGIALPPQGVYAGWAITPDGARHGAMVNIGIRPTFQGEQLSIEAHLFNFEGNLYGQELRVSLRHRLRAEITFEGPEPLKAQLRKDAVEARKLLGVSKKKRAKKAAAKNAKS